MARFKLVDEWRHAWKLGSVWFFWALAALSTAIIASAPGLVLAVLHAPPLDRLVVGGMIGFAIAGGGYASRIVKKVKPDDGQ